MAGRKKTAPKKAATNKTTDATGITSFANTEGAEEQAEPDAKLLPAPVVSERIAPKTVEDRHAIVDIRVRTFTESKAYRLTIKNFWSREIGQHRNVKSAVGKILGGMKHFWPNISVEEVMNDIPRSSQQNSSQ